MDIHVVRPGDTLYELAYQYGVPMSRLIQDNQLPDPSQLVVGQTLVIQYPRSTYTVRSGDTLFSIARNAGVPLRQLLRNNPGLEGSDRIYPGQELVLTYQQEKQGVLSVNGYAYPNIAPALLQRTLPFLSSLAPFTYRPTVRGDLIPLSDNAMVAAAQVMGVRPLLHLANLTEADSFSGELAHALLSSPEARTRLADHLMELLHRNGYRGIDVDLESIFPEDAQNYVRFLFLLRERLEPLGYPLLAALAPKTSACQQGELYQGHDYRGLGEAADGVLLMTYEWGYAFLWRWPLWIRCGVWRSMPLQRSRRKKSGWASPTTATTGSSPRHREARPAPCPIRRPSPWPPGTTPPSASTPGRRPRGSAMWTDRGRSMRSGSRTLGASAPSWPWPRSWSCTAWATGI